MQMKSEHKFFMCDCHTEALQIAHFTDPDGKIEDDMIYVALWHAGTTGKHITWKHRLKLIWRILKTGEPYTDQLILNTKTATELRDHLTDILPK